MENTLYYVHSDIDENNTAATFEDRESAIEYAKECGECWVDAVTYDENEEVIEAVTVWAYENE